MRHSLAPFINPYCGEKEPTMKYIVNNQIVLSKPLEGPLAAHIASFAQSASDQGYGVDAVYRRVLLASCFSRWLEQKAVQLPGVSSSHVASFLQDRARRIRLARGDSAALKQFLAFLHQRGIIPAEKAQPCQPTPVSEYAQGFERHLRDGRALADATIVNYLPFVRNFLTDCFGDGPVTLPCLCADEVVKFIQRQVPRLNQKRAKLLTTALRSFLKYALYQGDITLDLAAAVPSVANWTMTSIPRAIPDDQVRQLLASIDRNTSIGRRDYAILLILARLGLRSSEVAFLNLDDIDWKKGCLSVCGKSHRRIELPLPKEVGEAIVAYLQNGRPRCTSRRVFLRGKAPIRGFISNAAIGSIVQHTLKRAGIIAPTNGAHQFRHALATQMLRHGASLTEIGEILGHRSPETTKIYIKVDLQALRPLALPWPGVKQ